MISKTEPQTQSNIHDNTKQNKNWLKSHRDFSSWHPPNMRKFLKPNQNWHVSLFLFPANPKSGKKAGLVLHIVCIHVCMYMYISIESEKQLNWSINNQRASYTYAFWVARLIRNNNNGNMMRKLQHKRT